MKKEIKFDDLIRMAENYGVADNALFVSAARQYEIQTKVIKSIERILDEADLTVSKSYVKEVENVYANPLVKELPKQSDSANKTLAIMLDIIAKLGRKEEKSEGLEDVMNK